MNDVYRKEKAIDFLFSMKKITDEERDVFLGYLRGDVVLLKKTEDETAMIPYDGKYDDIEESEFNIE